MRGTFYVLLLLAACSLHAQPDEVVKFSRWNGQQWSAYAVGQHGITGSGWFNVLEVDSSGRIFGGGGFLPWEIFEWDGSDWRSCDAAVPMLGRHRPLALCIDSTNTVFCASTYDDTSSANHAEWKKLSSVLRWNGQQWQYVGDPLVSESYVSPTTGPDARISHLCSDAHNTLFASYAIPNQSGTGYDRWGLMQYSKGTWSTIDVSALSAVKYPTALCTDHRNRLYLSAILTQRTQPMGVYRWDGMAWTEIGFTDGLVPYSDTTYYRGIECMAVDELDQVYVTGYFKNLSGSWYVALWNGTQWTELGFNHFSQYSFIKDLKVYDAHHVYVSGRNQFGGSLVCEFDGLQWGDDWLSTDATDTKLAIDRFGMVYVPAVLDQSSPVLETPPSRRTVAPQPCDAYCYVQMPNNGDVRRLEVYNSLGEVVGRYTWNMSAGRLLLDTRNLPGGSYGLKVYVESESEPLVYRFCVTH